MGQPYFSALVRNQAAHDPKSQTTAKVGGLNGVSDEVLREIVRQSWALVANFDYERALRGART